MNNVLRAVQKFIGFWTTNKHDFCLQIPLTEHIRVSLAALCCLILWLDCRKRPKWLLKPTLSSLAPLLPSFLSLLLFFTAHAYTKPLWALISLPTSVMMSFMHYFGSLNRQGMKVFYHATKVSNWTFCPNWVELRVKSFVLIILYVKLKDFW